jgi:hypothetical protein
MARSIAKLRKTTARKDLLDIMMDSYLFASRKEARYALGATACAIRNWLIAMTENPPENLQTRLTIPGVGALRVGWYGYKDDKYPPRCIIRFGPTKKVRDQLRAHNKRKYEEWLSVPGTGRKPK